MAGISGLSVFIDNDLTNTLQKSMSESEKNISTHPYDPTVSPRKTYNFNGGWKFIRQDIPNALNADFDDSEWETISTPHTFNDIDTFNHLITRGGQQGAYMGIAWYRKHFRLPESGAGGKVFLIFEGMRQAGIFYLNGQRIGLYENGVTPYGMDITGHVAYGDEENILAVRIDNRTDYEEEATGVRFEWNTKDFNPDFGGINQNVWLCLTGKVYQTFPIYDGLQTTGVYIYPLNIRVRQKIADIHVESQVCNDSAHAVEVGLSVVIVGAKGESAAQFHGDTVVVKAGGLTVLHAAHALKNIRLWSDSDPYLYDVYTILTMNGKTADVVRSTTGFRKTAFRGGVGTGGVYLNDKFVYLTGYAQRSTNEWAALGQAYPDWMHDYTAQLIRQSNANYIRWMHVSPMRTDVTACNRYGIIEICPAGDKEKDAEGRQWEQRLEVMRNTMIHYRNDPSILFWESGNNGITAEHMRQMYMLKRKWDPHGGRAIGCRSLKDPDAIPFAEYFGVMVGEDPRTDELKTYTDTFRGYSAQRRDLAPLIECEDFRDEAARRFWDNYSPPFFGFKPGPLDTYHWNQESFCIAAIKRYVDYYSQIITNTDSERSKWSGYASIIFSDSDSQGRQDSSEVCRVSGKVDAVRLPKEIYYTYQVMQSKKPAIHIIGHWTYPHGTVKTMYVVSNCRTVELVINGKTIGKSELPDNNYLFSFSNVEWCPGTISAMGYVNNQMACEHHIQTAGEPVAVRLTPILGTNGFMADGSDVAMINVEVVDSQGRRCPTDDARIDFQVSGPCVWRGGYNSGIVNSTNNLYLNTECGINRVFVRSTLTAGHITVIATRKGLQPGVLHFSSQPVEIIHGLSSGAPRRLEAP